MMILDTNVISSMMMPKPDMVVANWLDAQAAESFWITSLTVYEVRYGLEKLPKGKKKQRLEAAFNEMLDRGIESRILSLNFAAVQKAASLAAKRYKIGRNIEIRDTLIAGIALTRRAGLVTRNTRHFDDLDIDIINPWQKH